VKFPIIADSGANFHMFRDIEFFETLAPVAGNVILGDGKTSVPIQGVGSIRLCLDGHILSVPDVRYVPSLAENIYSLFCHIQCPDHGVHSSFSEGLFLVFPNFRSKAILGDDIYVDAVPCVTTAVYSDSTNNGDSTVSLCRNMSQFQDEIQLESNKVDNLLASLCRYYKDIKTKRQLNLEVPAGFRQNNNFQRLLRDAQLYHLSQDISDCSSDDHIEEEILSDADKQPDIPMVSPAECTPVSHSDDDSNTRVPILRCIDKVSSSLPSRLTLNEDHIRACIGFRRIDTIKKNLSTLYKDTVHLDSTPVDAVLDKGDFATLRKTPRNTTPVPRPLSFGDVVHMDIVFGPEVALANVHYGLLFTDRFSHMTYLYPLQNLTSDIIKQLDAFFAHLGFLPKRLITDFDLKLIGGKSREQLPGKFWFLAVKRAAEICNYFPL
jgi:hypothetical protein